MKNKKGFLNLSTRRWHSNKKLKKWEVINWHSIETIDRECTIQTSFELKEEWYEIVNYCFLICICLNILFILDIIDKFLLYYLDILFFSEFYIEDVI